MLNSQELKKYSQDSWHTLKFIYFKIITQSVWYWRGSKSWHFLICILYDCAIPLSPTSPCLSGCLKLCCSASLPFSLLTFNVINSPCMSKWEPQYKCTLLVVSLPYYFKRTQLGLRPFGRIKSLYRHVYDHKSLRYWILGGGFTWSIVKNLWLTPYKKKSAKSETYLKVCPLYYITTWD